MRIVTWNVASLPPTARNIALAHKSLAAFFGEAFFAADIVCLQEVKVPSDKITKDLALVPGYESFWATSDERRGYSGVTTYARAPEWRPVSADAKPLQCDSEGRVVVTDHGVLVVVNVYVPNAGDRPARDRLQHKLAFLSELADLIDGLLSAKRSVICIGDFNVAAADADLHPAARPVGGAYEEAELAALARLTAALPDVWRRLHPEEDSKYTVWEARTSARAFNRGSRIDYVLVSPDLLPRVRACEIDYTLPPPWSDHAPLSCDVDVAPPAPPPAAPCGAWLALRARFVDPRQPSIAAMLAGRRPAKAAAAAKAAAGGGSGGGGSGGGGGSDAAGQQQPEQQKRPPEGDEAGQHQAAAAKRAKVEDQEQQQQQSEDNASLEGAAAAHTTGSQEAARTGSQGSRPLSKGAAGAGASKKKQPKTAAKPHGRPITSYFTKQP